MDFVFLKTRIKLIFSISVAGRFGQQLICGSLRTTALEYFGRNLCSDASRTQHQDNRCSMSRFRNKCLLWKFRTDGSYTVCPHVKQETSKNTNKEKEAKET